MEVWLFEGYSNIFGSLTQFGLQLLSHQTLKSVVEKVSYLCRIHLCINDIKYIHMILPESILDTLCTSTHG